MYDPKQEPHEFVGSDRAAAIDKACSFFGLSADQLVAKEYAGGEVYGLGGRTVVVAAPRDRRPPERSDRSERDSGGRGREVRDGRGGGRERGGRDREPRGGGGGRDRDRGGRGESRGRGDRERVREPEPERAPARTLSDEPSKGTAEGELGELGKFVLGVVERLDVGPFGISETQDGSNTIIDLKGAAAAVLSAGEGRAIDALQLIANQVLVRIDDDEQGRVVLEVEGGSESREDHLERLAERVVKRAIDGGRAIALDPMNGHDRRIIHIAVREHDGVATMSIGEGRFRQVVVVPEGAPEYEEAIKQSESGS